MNPLRCLCLMACLVAATFASPNQSGHRNRGQKPSQWFSSAQLESLPSVNEISIQLLETMPPQKGAELINSIYHLSQINHDLTPSFVPSANSIPAYILRPNGQNVSVSLNQLVAAAKQQPNFGTDEVTIVMTGMPLASRSTKKATRKLLQAYMQRYNAQMQEKLKQQQQNDYDYNDKNTNQGQGHTSSEEDYSQVSPAQRAQTGDLIVIDLGATLQPFKRAVMLDTEKTGQMIGDIIVELADQADVPEEIIHIVAQGAAANVAGAVGREYKRQTGRALRRITGLDPAKVYAKNQNSLAGLARGDADFVDCIHTSTYGMGTTARACDVDFYPNGPSVYVTGTDDIIESHMRATRYFAESVRPGNERNFPAVPANSLKQYQNKNGHGKRAYMGYATEFDVEGDYTLEVNPHSPFGKSAPAEQQQYYHEEKASWKQNGHNHQQNNNNNNDNDY